ncbi:hypothetical protein BYT27DRAFT_6788874 [Phlegmacium glaucopus]|nr:hypothetical protein BYT27DRAFT_6788874 [Phlegmacium glaucopus]
MLENEIILHGQMLILDPRLLRVFSSCGGLLEMLNREEKYTCAEYGYASINGVNGGVSNVDDMPSWFLIKICIPSLR